MRESPKRDTLIRTIGWLVTPVSAIPERRACRRLERAQVEPSARLFDGLPWPLRAGVDAAGVKHSARSA
jgi:hypothetical protein